jgi:hypothetical protein
MNINDVKLKSGSVPLVRSDLDTAEARERISMLIDREQPMQPQPDSFPRNSFWQSSYLSCRPFPFRRFLCLVIRGSLHAANLLLVQVLVQARVEVLPPLKQHRVADELEPGSEDQAGVFELLLELLWADILGVPDLVLVDVEVDIGLDEQNIVD